eukprot:CAMPEP_0182501698 /NCGR_PEP_ID=MMETSP1321-20130603/11955_1 /TAXON_ID=91990 /ORGANISM="Bolidomonas sp., Strain RCC1657" /LENGTH=229 /DNA_ID=CAMNT_0024706427 /DNA_START=228 /DNA_END=914 /DNA_ORIENTATION=+
MTYNTYALSLLLLLLSTLSLPTYVSSTSSSTPSYSSTFTESSPTFTETSPSTFTSNTTSTAPPHSPYIAMSPPGFTRTRPYAFLSPKKWFSSLSPSSSLSTPTPLIMFTGDNCAHCDEMEPNLLRLESDLHVTVARLNVWRSQLNFKLFEKLDPQQKCGGLPYFYNTKTKERICGATTFGNLRAWAKGQACNMFYYVPEKSVAAEAESKKKSVGLLGRVSSKISSMKEE